MKIFGFGLLRNGVKYDYCFEESLSSLSSLTESIFLALGDNEDQTEEKLNQIENLEITHTTWDLKKREGGLILSEQTNIALEALRNSTEVERDSWGIYLQCDEVLHEDDRNIILKDLKFAEENGYDAVSFRYLHFWKSHHDIAINKKWYPHEVRAIKLNTDIESWGDAQGFRNYKKVFHSEARVFHYGHVREEEKYKAKKKSILKLYHSDEKLPKYKRREKKFDDLTETLSFWGSHPEVMEKRIQRLGEAPFSEKVENVYLLIKKLKPSDQFIDAIRAQNVNIVSSIAKVPMKDRKFLINLSDSFIHKILMPSKVPQKMRSKLALDWSNEFIALLKCSEKGIGVDL